MIFCVDSNEESIIISLCIYKKYGEIQMIIKCPKCNTEFEIEDRIIQNKKMKFQCAECSFVWSVGSDEEELHTSEMETKQLINSDDVEKEKKKLLYGLGVEEKSMEKKSVWYKDLFTVRNGIVFLLGVFLFLVIFFVFDFLYDAKNENVSKERQNIFDRKDNKFDTSKLYIELAKPLTLVREGNNDYIIIRGFVYNPSSETLPVPKLIIKLENKDERVLQEQEREIDVQTLAPLEKTDFMFKVFKFSGQVQRVKVEFDDMNKI